MSSGAEAVDFRLGWAIGVSLMSNEISILCPQHFETTCLWLIHLYKAKAKAKTVVILTP